MGPCRLSNKNQQPEYVSFLFCPEVSDGAYFYARMNVVIPPKKQIGSSFSHRAPRYCSAAVIQRLILERCLELVKKSDISGQSWLDAGCGAGMFGDMLGQTENGFKLFQTDLAFGSLKLINSRKKNSFLSVQSDLEFLPFEKEKFHGTVISSVLQWLDDPSKGLNEIVRTLKPNGTVVFSAFLTGSFHQVCLLRERRDLSVPVRFVGEDEINALVNKCGLEILEFSTTSDVYYFQSAWDVIRYLSDIGSSAVHGKRLSRAGLLSFCEEYEDRFGTDRGIPLSYRVGSGIARKREGL
jgi:ubiquinone/menaquinone biosynthesis C-methylase UbiE